MTGEVLPPPPEPRQSWAGEQVVWLICPYLRDLRDCENCPRWKWDEHMNDYVQRSCFGLAEEAVNIAQTGNPWRRETVPPSPTGKETSND